MTQYNDTTFRPVLIYYKPKFMPPHIKRMPVLRDYTDGVFDTVFKRHPAAPYSPFDYERLLTVLGDGHTVSGGKGRPLRVQPEQDN